MDREVDDEKVCGVGLELPSRSRWLRAAPPAAFFDFVVCDGD
jgi:hypothetical protein